MIGDIADIATLTEPLEELGDSGITEMTVWLKQLQVPPHGRGSDRISPLTQLVTAF
jgi:hypothetical protein